MVQIRYHDLSDLAGAYLIGGARVKLLVLQFAGDLNERSDFSGANARREDVNIW